MRFFKLFSSILIAALVIGLPTPSSAQVSIGIGVSLFAPPALPVYVQPPAPAPNMIWNPGYWAWGPYGYYWVPGTWVVAPQVGVYWTPGYWGYNGGQYAWNAGYWGPTVGFYGGINYGAGYYGNGYVGGQWSGGAFQYNTAVSNVNTTIVHNTYINRSVVVNNTTINRAAYNGPGGVVAHPTSEQLQYERAHHIAPTPAQVQHQTIASQDHSLLASVNHGKPPVVAAPKPFTPANKPPGFKPVTPADK
ncbi:MAG TPA: YXWGXW repeat-containing protein, partial [Verrucomicrobiae bacterium]|nr:YXWGXW repeat-containing protein [Verrucomicrobiae bacterium]